MSTSTVSVCLATYNGALFLREQIDSVLAQLRAGDELVVADDGSQDNTPAVLDSYAGLLRIVARERVGGVVANFERAMEKARGDIIVLCDQDDVWLSGRLDTMRAALADTDLVLTNAWVVDHSLQGRRLTLFDQTRPTLSLWRNLRKNSFVGCCMGFRRKLLLRALPFPACTPWHDWLLGLIACGTARVSVIDTPMLLYRRHNANTSSTGDTSRNSLMRKIILRLRVLQALLICLLR